MNPAIERSCHPTQDRMADVPLYIRKRLPGIGLIPVPIEVLRHRPELDKEVARQVLRLDLAALFAPEPDEGPLIVTHDDPGIRAADERDGCLALNAQP